MSDGLTKSDARKRVEAIIHADQHSGYLEVTDIRDLGWGWVVFYGTASGDRIAGNAPYIVDKKSGEVIETGTAEPVESYVLRIERERGIEPA